ncbi:MAG: hypothetical protein JJE51_08230, partial [Thermoanaerobaculia bacterium]|nr:hypothetical protein [Thermoanaerobaculia bacterium]
MQARLITLVSFVALAVTGVVSGQSLAPREIWPQATTAAREGEAAEATKKTTELITTGRAYGLKTYPMYGSSAAALTRAAGREGKRDVAEWAGKAVAQLDLKSAPAAFSAADSAAERGDWAAAASAILRGFGNLFRGYRTKLLSRADLL